MVKHKKITKSNSLTIPKDLREESGIFSGMAVDVISDYATQSITIKKHVPACKFCNSVEDVHKIMGGMEVCRNCANKIIEEVKNKYGID